MPRMGVADGQVLPYTAQVAISTALGLYEPWA
jgi:hypothetical protein